jgi:hypothetical protein
MSSAMSRPLLSPRQAQLAMLQSRARNRPFYWASFIPTGAWASLAEKVQRQGSTGH